MTQQGIVAVEVTRRMMFANPADSIRLLTSAATSSNEQEELLPAGRENPRWIVWENLGGLKFRERVILDVKLGGHELQVGDVDRDGDNDICSKPWGPRAWNGNEGKMHVDFLENLQKR